MCHTPCSDPAWTTHVILEGSLGGSRTAGPIVQLGNWGMESSKLLKVTQLEYGAAGLPPRQPGFAADILNDMLEETPSGILNWNYLVQPIPWRQQAVQARALDEPQFQL